VGKISEAYIDVIAKDNTAAGLNQARDKLGRFVADQGKQKVDLPLGIKMPSGKVVGAMIGGAAAGALAFLVDAGNKAGDLAETMNKVGVVFGDNAGEITGFAQTLADAFGLVKKDTLDAAAGFALLGQGVGMSKAESTAFAQSLTMLAADASSFHNVPLAEAIERITAGLRGEADPLEKFGAGFTAATVEAKALQMGLAGTKAELTEYDKVVARAAVITERMAVVNGDLANTYDSLSNQKRKFAGDLENMQTELGKAMIEPMSEAIQLAYDLGDAIAGIGSERGGMQAIADFLGGIIEQLRFVTQTGMKNFVDEGFWTMASAIDPTGYSAGKLHEIQTEKAHSIAETDEARAEAGKAARDKARGFSGKFDPRKSGALTDEATVDKEKAAKAETAAAKKAKAEADKKQKKLFEDSKKIYEESRSPEQKFEDEKRRAFGLMMQGGFTPQIFGDFLAKESGVTEGITDRKRKIAQLEHDRAKMDPAMFGDLYSAHKASELAGLKGDPALDTLNKQLTALESIEKAVRENRPGAFNAAQAILHGPT
jgi:hypothetical protein